jgi:branched-chain amino acid transport system substrate-binding protein
MSDIDNEGKDCVSTRAAAFSGIGACACHGGHFRRRAVLRPVETQSRVVADRPEEAARDRAHVDASGQYAASGMDERLGAMMAIKGSCKGGAGPADRGDPHGHRNDAGTARLITRNETAFLIGALHGRRQCHFRSRNYGCIFLNTNSARRPRRAIAPRSSSGTATERISRWRSSERDGGQRKNWLLLVTLRLGHQTSKATRTIVEANGGKIVRLLEPQNTRDFSSYLLKIQQIKPNVVAAAVGGDDIKALQQVVQVKLNKSPAWINNQQIGPMSTAWTDAIFGVFGTNWYYRLDLPGVKEFVAAYQTTYPGVQIRVPGNTYYNGYMATRELLRAVERAGTTNNIKVIKELEALKVSARDRMQDFDAYMNPATHQLQQTIYMATYNDAPAEKDDIFRILAKLPPKDVEDPDAPGNCKLESYEATPTYEM